MNPIGNDELGLSLSLPRCPHCRIDNPNLEAIVNAIPTTDLEQGIERLWRMYACRRCGGVVTAWAFDFNRIILGIFPEPSGVAIELPQRSREYLSQAQDSVHSPAGAVILAASAVDAMLKAKGYKEGSLYGRIEKASDDHLITEEMAQWAHQVRLDANSQRHADDADPLPTKEDAERSIEFARALGQFLFVLPARVAAGLKKSQPPSGGEAPS